MCEPLGRYRLYSVARRCGEAVEGDDRETAYFKQDSVYVILYYVPHVFTFIVIVEALKRVKVFVCKQGTK